MSKIKIIDLHCDTIHKIFHLEDKNLFKNSYAVDIQKLQKGNAIAQFFALFVDKGWIDENNLDIYTHTKEFYRLYKDKLEENKDYIHHALNYQDMVSNMNNKKISAFLTIEEGDFLQGKIERLKEFYDLGLRLITFTWNYENCIGYPNSLKHDMMQRGLKKFGFEVVEKMNDLGMIIDVSHLSDGGFYDVIAHSKKPVVASHSNARELQNVPRNMNDNMIKKLADNGGVMGINFCPHFLNEGNTSKIASIVDHINYIINVGGTDIIALGTDFDGIKGDLQISNIGEIEKLFIQLEKQGMSNYQIEKISYLNAVRIIQDCLN